MIRRKNESSDTILTYRGLSLNRATYTLSYESTSVRLGNKEYQMMEMLMLTPGHIFSTEQMMEKIWGYDSEAELNVVWVYLSYLRRKLRQIGCPYQIQSNRGIGYSLGGEP